MKKFYNLKSALIAFFFVLLALVSCKKGSDDPVVEPSKTATFPQNSGTPGDLITIKTSFKLEKENSEITFGSKATTASRLSDSTLAFFVPYVPSGKVQVDLSNIGITEPYQFTVNAYTPVANPAQVVAEFNTLLTETINDTELTELSQPAAAIKESFAAKYQALSAEEQAEVAFLIQKLYAYPELSSIASSAITAPRLLSAGSSIGTRSSLKDFEVPASINSDQHYRQTIIQCGGLYVISGSALLLGANMMAAPSGVTQVAGAASLAFSVYTFSKALKCRRVLYFYQPEITEVSRASIFELAGASNFAARLASSAPQTTALQSTKLSFQKNLSYRLSANGSFTSITKSSKSTLIQEFISKVNSFASVYNTGVALVNKVKGWFIKTPDFPPFNPEIPEQAEEVTKTLPAQMLSIQNISNKGISLALSGTGEQGVIKASSTTVTSEVDFTFELVYQNSIIGVTSKETVNASFDPNVYAHRLALESGNDQLPEAGKKLPNPLKVVARDQNGNVLEGVKVEWKVKSGGGTLSVQESLTNAQGIAQAEWTPGTTGTQEVEALTKKKDGSLVIGAPVSFRVSSGIIGRWQFVSEGYESSSSPWRVIDLSGRGLFITFNTNNTWSSNWEDYDAGTFTLNGNALQFGGDTDFEDTADGLYTVKTLTATSLVIEASAQGERSVFTFKR